MLRLDRNQLANTLPEQLVLWDATRSLTDLVLSRNVLTGILPAVLGELTGMKTLGVSHNRFEGSIPISLAGAAALARLAASHNHLAGSLPDSLGGLTALTDLVLSRNHLAGALAPWVAGMRLLQQLKLSSNRFEGGLLSTIAGIQALVVVLIDHNLASGTIPPTVGRSGRLQALSCRGNRLSGTIPTSLSSGALRILHLSQNHLSGTIPNFPDCTNSSSQCFLQDLWLGANHLEGAIPEGLGSALHLRTLMLSETLMEGSIPAGIAALQHLEAFSSHGLSLRGTIPAFSWRASTLLLGHGLEGRLPSLGAELLVLGVAGNNLQGNLPRLHFREGGLLLAHHNRFSCKPPLWEGVRLNEHSLAIVGNRFMLPASATGLPNYPQWINPVEQRESFFVSDVHGFQLLRLAVASSLFLVAAFSTAWFGCCTSEVSNSSSVGEDAVLLQRRIDTQRSTAYTRYAFLAALLTLHMCALIAVPVLLAYLSVHPLQCMTALSRMQVGVDSAAVSDEAAAGILHLFAAAACLNRLSPDWKWSARRYIPSLSWCDFLAASALWCAWLSLCLLFSVFGVAYVATSIVPLALDSMFATFVDQGAVLANSLLMAFFLPTLAASLAGSLPQSTGVKPQNLVAVGMMLLSWLVPCFLLVFLHGSCMGHWVLFWEPCEERGRSHLHASMHIASTDVVWNAAVDLCSLEGAALEPARCRAAVMEHMSPWLFATLLHMAFTVPALQLMFSKSLDADASLVTLAFFLELVVVFASSMPLLLFLILLAVVMRMCVLFSGVVPLEQPSDESGGATASSARNVLELQPEGDTWEALGRQLLRSRRPAASSAQYASLPLSALRVAASISIFVHVLALSGLSLPSLLSLLACAACGWCVLFPRRAYREEA